MYKYVFSGVIHPERADFSIAQEISLKLQNPSFGIDVDPILEIKKSRFTITFDSSKDYWNNPSCNTETLKNYVEDAVRLVVDIFCFVKSYNYDVEISTLVCNDLKMNQTFGVQGEWNLIKDDQETNEEFTKILKLIDRAERVFMKDVFADFRKSIKYPSMTASHCFRAIETIRKFYFENSAITDKDKKKKDGWEKMNTTLNYTEKDYSELKKFALPNRHGDYPLITYPERERIMNFTRTLIDDFVDLLVTES